MATLLAAGAWAQEVPHASAEYGVFALPDQSGRRLIATAGMPGADRARHALCSDGRNVAVRFDHSQVEGKESNGRQVPSRFDQLSGDVFKITGTVSPEASCFVVGDGWVSKATVIPMRPASKDTACGKELEGRLAQAKGRSVKQCFPLNQLGINWRIVLAEFARVANHALASAVISSDRLLFADYPAEFRGEGEDLWRVDDGGELSTDGLRVMFVAHLGDRYAMAVSWAGTEGRSLALFAFVDNEFKRVLADYWYQMPE